MVVAVGTCRSIFRSPPWAAAPLLCTVQTLLTSKSQFSVGLNWHSTTAPQFIPAETPNPRICLYPLMSRDTREAKPCVSCHGHIHICSKRRCTGVCPPLQHLAKTLQFLVRFSGQELFCSFVLNANWALAQTFPLLNSCIPYTSPSQARN